jgi:hypothetical protein
MNTFDPQDPKSNPSTTVLEDNTYMQVDRVATAAGMEYEASRLRPDLEDQNTSFSFSTTSSASTPLEVQQRSLFLSKPPPGSYPITRPPSQTSSTLETIPIVKLRGGSCNDANKNTSSTPSSSSEKKNWNRKLGNDERVPAALWLFAGGSGESPTAGQMRAGKKVAKAEEVAKEKAYEEVRKADAERAAARKTEGKGGLFGRWKRNKDGEGGGGNNGGGEGGEEGAAAA